MPNDQKTQGQLISELADTRKRISELEDLINEHQELEQILQRECRKLGDLLNRTIITLALAVEARDPFSIGHQKRVARLSCAFAENMGLLPEKIENIRMASLVHDIGKITVSPQILTKKGQLVDSEYLIVKNHPKVGYDILKEAEFPEEVTSIVLQHHERINGSGYPQGLKRSEIMLEARIVAVADVVEAITSKRSYRSALGLERAIKELKAYSGLLYDCDVVESCLNVFEERQFHWKEQEVFTSDFF